MKIRDGFVSNSSSSSFVILEPYQLTDRQRWQIENHVYCGHQGNNNSWHIDQGARTGYTNMDNFDIHAHLLEVVGIPDEFIRMGRDA